MIIVLDSGVLGSVTNPNPKSSQVTAIITWAAQMQKAGHTFAIPAIADYETRRELVRQGIVKSIAAHDAFCQVATNIYLPISGAVLRRATDLWAQARNTGKTTASDAALDGDVILCAHVLEAGYTPGTYLVATTNTKHLNLFVDADDWQNITP
ncbi:MAG: hypothetical protein H7Y38_15980 [Armatimonadetes bacterium]|nr:hypothetical protein [Armatimonadota bacterium]